MTLEVTSALWNLSHHASIEATSLATMQYGNALSLRWPFWYTRDWTACHHITWQITVNSSQPLASWLKFNVPFQHKYGYIRDKRSGVKRYPYPVKEGQRYINLNPGRRRLRSPNVATCVVPRTRTTLARSILHCCWSISVEQSTTSSRDFELSLFEFHRLLKTHLFGWGTWRLVTYFRRNALNKCTYLLS